MKKNNHPRKKTQNEIDNYMKSLTIKETDTTVDKKNNFSASNNTEYIIEEEIENELTQPPSFNLKIKKHISNNWPTWLFGALALLFGGVFFNHNLKINSINNDIKYINSCINEIKSDDLSKLKEENQELADRIEDTNEKISDLNSNILQQMHQNQIDAIDRINNKK